MDCLKSTVSKVQKLSRYFPPVQRVLMEVVWSTTLQPVYSQLARELNAFANFESIWTMQDSLNWHNQLYFIICFDPCLTPRSFCTFPPTNTSKASVRISFLVVIHLYKRFEDEPHAGLIQTKLASAIEFQRAKCTDIFCDCLNRNCFTKMDNEPRAFYMTKILLGLSEPTFTSKLKRWTKKSQGLLTTIVHGPVCTP